MENTAGCAVLLGVVQGLTEFLPVSSSGHLALFQNWLAGFSEPGLLNAVMLHVGTLVAVLAYYRKEIADLARWGVSLGKSSSSLKEGDAPRLAAGVLAASVPTAVIGLGLEAAAEELFSTPRLVGAALVGTALMLAAGELAGARQTRKAGPPDLWRSLLIGVAQGLAVIPGISRSGATISMARALGIEEEEAARFSFLASLPAVAGAAGLMVWKNLDYFRGLSGKELAESLLGPAVAAGVGYLAIFIVVDSLKKRKFYWFAIYCGGLGLLALLVG